MVVKGLKKYWYFLTRIDIDVPDYGTVGIVYESPFFFFKSHCVVEVVLDAFSVIKTL